MQPSTETKILKAIAGLSKQMDSKLNNAIAGLSKSVEEGFRSVDENTESLSKSVDERFDRILEAISNAFHEQDEKIEDIKKQNNAILNLLDAPAKEMKAANAERAANTSAHERFEARITALETNHAA